MAGVVYKDQSLCLVVSEVVKYFFSHVSYPFTQIAEADVFQLDNVSASSSQSLHASFNVCGISIDVRYVLEFFVAWHQSELVVVPIPDYHPLDFLWDKAIGGVGLRSTHLRSR